MLKKVNMSDVFQFEIDKTNSYYTINEQQVVKRNTSKLCEKQETSDIEYDKKSGNPASTENKVQNSLVQSEFEKCNVVQSATKTYPVNQFEALKVLQQHFRTITEEIFGPDTNMFDYLTWIAMGCGLKYVHYCNNEKVDVSITRQDEKLNESIARGEKRLEHDVNRLEHYIDKSISNVKEDLKDRFTQISAIKRETNSQDEKFDKLVSALESSFAQNMSDISRSVVGNKSGPEETKSLELQRQLLSQFLETFQNWQAEVRQKDLTSNKEAYYTEQELALKAAMNRYSERVNRNLPKYLACQYQKLQEATLQFQSYVKESENLGEAGKSKEDIQKVLTKLQVESNGLCSKVLEVMKPTMRVTGPWIRRLKP